MAQSNTRTSAQLISAAEDSYNLFQLKTPAEIGAGVDNAAAALTHIEDTNNPHGVSKSQIGLSNVDNTSDDDKPVSTATQAALNSKINSDVSGVSGADTITNIISLTQLEYDSIINPDANTLYIITG